MNDIEKKLIEKYGERYQGFTSGNKGAEVFIDNKSIILTIEEIKEPIESIIELIEERLK